MNRKKATLIAFFIMIAVFAFSVNSQPNNEVTNMIKPRVVEQFLEKAKNNDNWKTAFMTGEQEQIVFMNVSPVTNPNNEIGKEIHEFDQVIMIVQGEGKAVLNGQTSLIKEGDMIFIPRGVEHNVINSNQNKGLKLVSFYSNTDIPKDAVFKKKADEAED
jgi:quercetin dioxygenase-like cupin family protein